MRGISLARCSLRAGNRCFRRVVGISAVTVEPAEARVEASGAARTGAGERVPLTDACPGSLAAAQYSAGPWRKRLLRLETVLCAAAHVCVARLVASFLQRGAWCVSIFGAHKNVQRAKTNTAPSDFSVRSSVDSLSPLTALGVEMRVATEFLGGRRSAAPRCRFRCVYFFNFNLVFLVSCHRREMMSSSTHSSGICLERDFHNVLPAAGLPSVALNRFRRSKCHPVQIWAVDLHALSTNGTRRHVTAGSALWHPLQQNG